MKKIILLGLSLLFLATTFKGDRLTGWVQQTIPRQDLEVLDLQFVDSLNGFFVSSKYLPSDSAFIFKTTDGGNNWSTSLIDNIYLTSIQFIDNNLGFSVGRDVIPINGLIKITTNGGLNWVTKSIISGSGILEGICFANKDTGWVCSRDLTAGGLWRTINGGNSWQKQLNESVRPSKIFFANSNTGWVIGNAGQNLYKTTNSGQNWFVQSSTSSEFYSDVFFATSDTGWIVKNIGTENKSLVRSTNGGNNWVSVNAPIIPTESRLCFIGNRYGWAGSLFHKIYATKDGYNWGTQYSPSNRSDNIYFVDSLHGWAGYSGLVKTTDGGGPITYTGITRNGDFVPSFELGQNYPNPFNASTRIKFSVLKPSYIELKIFNISGREIARLITGQQYNPGEYNFYFDAGKYSLTSGIYFYLMRGATTDNKEIFIDTKKLMLIK